MKEFRVTLIAALFMLSACSETGDSKYFPLEQGITRTYHAEATGRSGVRTAKFIYRTENFVENKGLHYLKVAQFARGAPSEDSQFRYYRNGEKGLFMRKKPDGSDILLYPWPVQKGKEWTVEMEDKRYTAQYARFEDVPAASRTYQDCAVVEKGGLFEGRQLKVTEYLCPKIGRVRREVRGSNIDQVYILEE